MGAQPRSAVDGTVVAKKQALREALATLGSGMFD
jgi:hypothetical protein